MVILSMVHQSIDSLCFMHCREAEGAAPAAGPEAKCQPRAL